jgi:hypothetical protein
MKKLRIFLLHRKQNSILKKLIPYYKKCLSELDEINYRTLGDKYNIMCGICFCARMEFKTDIYDADWVQEHSDNGFWFLMPDSASDFIKYKDRVQKRIELMEKILKEL